MLPAIEKKLVGKFGQTGIHEKWFDKPKPLSKPVFSISRPDFLDDDDKIIAFYNGENWRVFPTKVLDKHQIVHTIYYDQFKEKKKRISVTYCPLTGCGKVYEGKIGNTGSLYENNMVLYNKKKRDSYFLQFNGLIVSGEGAGSFFPSSHKFKVIQTTYQKFCAKFEDFAILIGGEDSQSGISYHQNAQINYEENNKLFYVPTFISTQFHSKQPVMGIKIGTKYLAIVINSFEPEKRILVEFEDHTYEFNLDVKLEIYTHNYSHIETNFCYWFAWYAFHPDTQVVEV